MRVYERREDKKVCWAKAGQVIRLLDQSMNPAGPYFLVVCIPASEMGHREKNPRALASNGLYSSLDTHGLVNLSTGELAPMPHLSSRMVEVRDAQLVVGKVNEEEYSPVCN